MANRHLSYSNVAATLALVFAMGGGTAIAAQKLITGDQIAPGHDHRRRTSGNTRWRQRTSRPASCPRALAVRPGAQGRDRRHRPRRCTPGSARVRRGRREPPARPGTNGSSIAFGDLQGSASGAATFNTALSKGFTTATLTGTASTASPYPAGVTTNLPLTISDSSLESRPVEPGEQRRVQQHRLRGRGRHPPGQHALAAGDGLSISVP